MAVQMLFQSDLGNTSIDTILADFDPSEYGSIDPQSSQSDPGTAKPKPGSDSAFDYARSLVTGTLAHLGEIDELIRLQAEHWRLERMPAVDRNILRLAIYEFLYEDVPKRVVINEALEVTKRFSGPEAVQFVNGVLDAVRLSIEAPEAR